MITTHGRTHYSPDTCYGCFIQSITLNNGRPKTHQRHGDPWEGNPVKERIEELQAAGRRVQAMELANPNHQPGKD